MRLIFHYGIHGELVPGPHSLQIPKAMGTQGPRINDVAFADLRELPRLPLRGEGSCCSESSRARPRVSLCPDLFLKGPQL